MKKGAGKRKGGAFERRMAKRLSLWWTGGERDDVIWRTQLSGGRATVRGRKGKTSEGQYGDLTYTDPIAKPLFDLCVIECKHGYGKWSVLDLIDNPDNAKYTILEGWIERLREIVVAADAVYGIILAQRTRRLPVAVVDLDLILELERLHTEPTPMIEFGTMADRWFVVYELERFLKSCKPDQIRRLSPR